MNENDTSGFFLFDFNEMEVSYGRQAFEAIYESLRKSSGTCAFHDGDIFDATVLRELVSQADSVKPVNDESPLKNNESYPIGPYLVSIYTESHENFDTVHDFLVAKNLQGYVGCFTLSGFRGFEEFLRFVVQDLGSLIVPVIDDE